ncbi:MAG: NAD(P)H-dependent glycerol-3-phosphate dehydrogenase [Acidobacteriota bacterium]
MKKLAVLGAGSWGTALAVHLAERGLELDASSEVVLWARRPDFARRLQQERTNEPYLEGAAFPENLKATAAMEETVDADAVLVVVPSHGFRQVVADFLRLVPEGADDKILVSGTKGIETDGLARMSEVTAQEAAKAGRGARFAVLAGPSFAAELVRGMPTAAVVAAEDGELAAQLRTRLASPTFRLYSTTDVVGVELGGTSKNVIAIAAGVVSGLGLGHNTMAALLTRGLHEITRLGVACGGQTQTMAGLAGMGDLVLTCTGGLSRNRRLGEQLAKGWTLERASASTPMVAEGVRNSRAIQSIAGGVGVEMPITHQMVQVLYHGKDPRQSVEELMTRELRSEAEL